ncbi:MAG TPA: phosphate/phosphite/phosphonate ABC transporter substrate-binding protein [Stellaceae bacterium]|nr:phosphate/phosphite/phosphonate ABC transporter substrate-binding protein [Stellaceae bacterium]
MRCSSVLLPLLLVAALFSSAAGAEDAVRVGMIPDAGATQVSIDEKAPLRDYLAKAVGKPVELIIPTNYNATVEALGNGSLDFAYLGGLTYVKAHARYGVDPLVQRDADREFHALFITGTDSPVHTLADLKGKRFAFGDINSTSGHLMPYAVMREAGIDANKDLTFRYTGSHPATAKAVEAGAVDAGAIDESVYQAMLADGSLDKAKVRVFHTSPPFVDYVWVARKDVGAAEREKFAQAFLALDPARDAKVLSILRGTKFVRATDDEYEGLRKTAQELTLF